MKNFIYKTLLLTTFVFISCDDDFLDKKPDKSIVVPSTLDDLQALLDNTRVMNNTAGLSILGSDDIFISDVAWDALSPLFKNGYIWAEDVFGGTASCTEWTAPYEQVFYANVVLDGLGKLKMTSTNETEWKNIKGRALFYRAFAFWELAQIFCQPYHAGSLSSLGVPLRLASDVTTGVGRATLKETYDQIIRDLLEAEKLLPLIPAVKTQPASAANHALLARVYLSMEDYENAEIHAAKALSIDGTLLDYNALDESSLRPFTSLHDEVVFHASVASYGFLRASTTYIDTLLIASYDANDLRKTVFFRTRGDNRYTFKATYTGNLYQFGGISNNEVYLTRAECRARNGNIDGALEDLNTLLIKRWRTGTFVPIAERDPEVLLSVILDERRKELVYRGTRWTDLRRLNRDSRFAKTLTRKVHGEVYTIPPNDSRYVYPIPFQEISLSGIEQNVR